MSFEDNNDPEDELPDWLKNLQDTPGDPAESSVDPEEDNSEKSQGRKFFSVDKTEESFEPATRKKASEFLHGDDLEEENDTDSWLESIREQQKPVFDDGDKEEYENPADFLEKIKDSEIEDQDVSDGDAQGWMAEIKDSAGVDDEEAEQSEPPAPEEEPDWQLDTKSKHTAPLTSELKKEGEVIEEDVEVPDWLKKIQNGEPQSDVKTSSSEDEEPEGEDSGETGDWIKKFTGSLKQKSSEPKPEFNLDEDLDWLAEEDISPLKIEELNVEADNSSEEELGQEPDWLLGTEDVPSDSPESEELETTIPETLEDETEEKEYVSEDLKLDSDEIPDWQDLRESLVGEKSEDQLPQDPEDTIAQSDLPGWFEDSKSGEDKEDEIQEEIETLGPLYGLKNVLPADPDGLLFSTHQLPRVDLYVSNTQKSHVSILQNIVSEEAETPSVEKKSLAIPQQIFRWLIAALIYAAVLIPVLSNQTSTPLPSIAHPEITAMADTINSLEPMAPVLVAFEYQPGYSGEMEAASAAVLDHLLTGGAQLSFISTSPTGPGLIEHYLDNILSNHDYINDHKYPNFGYISGGTAALLNFASNPQRTVPVVSMRDLEGNLMDGWKIEPLIQIKEIRDFAMILVISDDPTTAISWIEQVQPLLLDKENPENSVPLAMVISAQAEPLVYPYYDNDPKQVSALVSGLFGGATYETIGDRNNIASSYWDGFGNGLSVTISIVLLGGLFNLIYGWQKTRQKVR